MVKLNLNELEKLRKNTKDECSTEIIVSMGTCGIAAGGNEVYDYFSKEIVKQGLPDVLLKKTGCLGLCYIEPNVIVKTKDQPAILYGNVNMETAIRILNEHVRNSQIVNDFVVAMPSEDIYCLCKKQPEKR
ncbi:MAG: (2Fe-2S) ferredoxin domain-containing protein [bacterium]|nr:(2Fe-2S) ferredoxin domain-containing protein [bacterium]